MPKFTIVAKQINYMQIEVEAEDFEDAQDIYYDTEDFIETDFTRVSSEWNLWSITDENGVEEEYYFD